MIHCAFFLFMPLLQYCKSESGFKVTFHTLNFSQTTSLVLREEDQAESVGLRICFLYYSPLLTQSFSKKWKY